MNTKNGIANAIPELSIGAKRGTGPFNNESESIRVFQLCVQCKNSSGSEKANLNSLYRKFPVGRFGKPSPKAAYQDDLDIIIHIIN